VNFYLFDNNAPNNNHSYFNISDLVIFSLGLIIFLLIYFLFYFKKKKISFFLLPIILFLIIVIIFSLYKWIITIQINLFDPSILNEKNYYYWFSKIIMYIPLTGIVSTFFLILYGSYLSPYMCESFLTCYLDVIFRFLGFIGIITLFLSYYNYKKNKQLFFFY